MNAIDNLVFNTLVKHDVVYLPGIGCLKVVGSKTKNSKGKIGSPKLTVTFTTAAAKNSISVVELIAQNDGVDNQGAQTLYGEWLSNARRADGKIVIEGVGTIGSKSFTPNGELQTALNNGEMPEVAVCKTKKCKCCWIWWLVGALVVAAAVLCYIFCCPCCSKEAVEETVVVEVVEPVAEVPAEESVPETTVSPVGKARYNISVGVFEYKGNAQKCAAADPVGIGAENYLIAPFPSGWEVVIAYSTDNWDEAVAAWRRYKKIVPDVWIYRKY